MGPAPAVASDDGELIVYSADDAIDTADSEHPHHRRYVIRAADGSVLRSIENQTGPFGQDPEDVTLPPGRYAITVRPNGGRGEPRAAELDVQSGALAQLELP